MPAEGWVMGCGEGGEGESLRWRRAGCASWVAGDGQEPGRCGDNSSPHSIQERRSACSQHQEMGHRKAGREGRCAQCSTEASSHGQAAGSCECCTAADIAPISYHTQHARQQHAAQSGAPRRASGGQQPVGGCDMLLLLLNTHAHTICPHAHAIRPHANTHPMTPNTRDGHHPAAQWWL